MSHASSNLFFVIALWGSHAVAQEQPASPETNPLRQAIKELNWIKGPQAVELFKMASVKVPVGYVFLNPEDTQKFQTILQNPSSGTEYMLSPENFRWMAFFHFSADGYVRDDEGINPDSLLATIKKNTELSNVERRQKGWPEMTIVGWRILPNYNKETKHLEWAIDGRSSDNSSVVNFNTRILGRSGVTSATLVVDPETLTSGLAEFKNTLTTYEYSPSERYAAFKAGDKVAEYGLAALITGGAVAVATKAGFWKAIGAFLIAGWKLVVAGVAAFVAFLKNLFKRRKPEDVAT